VPPLGQLVDAKQPGLPGTRLTLAGAGDLQGIATLISVLVRRAIHGEVPESTDATHASW